MDIGKRVKDIKRIDNSVNITSVVVTKDNSSVFQIVAFHKDLMLTITYLSDICGYDIRSSKNVPMKCNAGRSIKAIYSTLERDCIAVDAKAFCEPVLKQVKLNLEECCKNV